MARTKPRQESYAHENVIRQGYEAYLPRCFDEHTRESGVMFPGYLFVLVHDRRWTWLRNTYGILGLIFGADSSPARIDAGVVHSIKSRENERGLIPLPYTKFRHGQRVRLHCPGSAYDGLLGLYDCHSGLERVRVLLSILGRYTPTEVEDRIVETA